MAVMTIAICDEIRKDAQKLYRQLSILVPDAELLLYRTRESLLKGLAEGHKICDLIFLGLDGDQGHALLPGLQSRCGTQTHCRSH